MFSKLILKCDAKWHPNPYLYYTMTTEDPFLFALEEAHNVAYQPTTIAYARSLLVPYQEALAQSDDPEALKQWVTQAFPQSIRESILNEIEAEELEAVETDEMVKALNLPGGNWGDQIRSLILGNMANALLLNIDDLHVANETDVAALPWDLVEAIDDEWAPLFGIDKANKTLPVTVTIGPQQFTHPMTLEQAMGLLLFSKVSGVNFQPMMFGQALSYFEDQDENGAGTEHARFNVSNSSSHFPGYRVTVGGHVYQFMTPDFMQGFKTGAMWTGVDHRSYWSNLQRWRTPTAIPKTLQFQ